LPSARDPALGKAYKNPKTMFAECLPVQHSAKKFSCKFKELASKNDINVHIQQKSIISCIIICISD